MAIFPNFGSISELMRPMKESAKLTHTRAMDPLLYFRIQYVPLRLI